MLTDEGTVVLKFWIHLSKEEQKARLRALDRDPLTKWQVTKDDWRAFRLYSKSHRLWESVLRETSTGVAPWYVVEGADERYRNLTVGKILLSAIKGSIAADATAPKRSATPPPPSVIDNVKLIRDLDLTKKLSEKVYDNDLGKYQGKLAKLSRHKRFADHSLILVFEGVDAAGKGGAIRRVTGALDARQYLTVPIAAPTEEELAHPYLWRFWRHVPALGGITHLRPLLVRTCAGRTRRAALHTRTSGCARTRRSTISKNDSCFNGAIVVKFWLQISKAEQLRRFKAREKTSFKQFKITPEDWRNRKRWPAYEVAVCDMVDRTSTEIAPWTLVEAEDKYYARIKILKTIVDRMERALKQ